VTWLSAKYLACHASVPIALSARLAADLVAAGHPLPANVTQPDRAVRYIFRASDLSSDVQLARWPATRHNTFGWIGPREVNLNYYPTWIGLDHAIILRMEVAKEMGIVAALEGGHQAAK
jgi:hypothetical protein